MVNTNNVRPASGFEFDMPAVEVHHFQVFLSIRLLKLFN
jgi:hypothetical protein